MAETKTIYLAMHDHKHGMDVTAHTTEEGAKNWCIRVMREDLEERGSNSLHMTDDELWKSWSIISGETEFFSIEPTQLHHDVSRANEEGSVDTSHIGA